MFITIVVLVRPGSASSSAGWMLVTAGGSPARTAVRLVGGEPGVAETLGQGQLGAQDVDDDRQLRVAVEIEVLVGEQPVTTVEDRRGRRRPPRPRRERRRRCRRC